MITFDNRLFLWYNYTKFRNGGWRINLIKKLINSLLFYLGYEVEVEGFEKAKLYSYFLNNYCRAKGVSQAAELVGEITLEQLIIAVSEDIKRESDNNPAAYTGSHQMVFEKLIKSFVAKRVAEATPEAQLSIEAGYGLLKKPGNLVVYRKLLSNAILKFVLEVMVPNNNLLDL